MTETLHELLVPHLRKELGTSASGTSYALTMKYLGRLTTLQLDSLQITEPHSLDQASHSFLLSLQSLCTRSSKSIIASTNHLNNLQTEIPELIRNTGGIQDEIAALNKEAVGFLEKYSRSSENEVLDKRKKSLLMLRNVDRLSDILDLPTLLASSISSSTTQGVLGNTNYASALDLYSHIKQLYLVCQSSQLLISIYDQAEDAMREMTSNLIVNLRGQGLKLAAAMRTIGWLRRIAPELSGATHDTRSFTDEGSLGSLFLVCRLTNLMYMLDALSPLRDLADQESEKRLGNKYQTTNGNAWSGGQQTERFLKRYIEIFREQSFAIISMFINIFPPEEAVSNDDLRIQFKLIDFQSASPQDTPLKDNLVQPLPSALATFPMHLVDLLLETLQYYMPNVRDKASRESLLTQVLYCANSLGRLGADFGIVLAFLEDDGIEEDDTGPPEWALVIQKHRGLASRLELLAGNVGGPSKGPSASSDIVSKPKSSQSLESGIES
ncbi:hypothetical protein MMC19_007234 [Ptychographa xylographoides]|nr:hypothetical protein [Ptychographa xylographoides]